jgi:hypothetical protein
LDFFASRDGSGTWKPDLTFSAAVQYNAGRVHFELMDVPRIGIDKVFPAWYSVQVDE